ncbi:MAG: 4-alpha-glucanotransferase, partial [Actinomycetota bacterium]|nr:4-alpha-glucanotransferase [Actinomycetota bacterium]
MPDPKDWGVDSGYFDDQDEWRDAPPETIASVFEAMGATEGGPQESPVVVARAGKPLDVAGAVEVVTEDGGSAAPGDELPPGYHRLVYADGSEKELISSPGRCFLPEGLRTWGWGVQLYSARSRRSWGIGDLGDLADLGRWARGEGAGMLLINPLHAPKPGPQQPSPYFPSSRRWRNPLYLRVEDVPGADAAVEDLAGIAARGRALSERETIDRDAIYALKMDALARIWPLRRDSPAFHDFRARHGASLTDFATYMTLVEHHGGGPLGWPQEHRDPRGSAVTRFRVANEDRVLFHEWVQWLLEDQLTRASEEIGLVHDLAVGVD